MLREMKITLVLFTLLTLLTGVVYPGVVWLFAEWVVPARANGSVIEIDGKAVGSRLLGQPFSSPRYFWGRPSATAPFPYNAAVSSGSNLGAINPNLQAAVRERIAALRAADPADRTPVPVDLVTASAADSIRKYLPPRPASRCGASRASAGSTRNASGSSSPRRRKDARSGCWASRA